MKVRYPRQKMIAVDVDGTLFSSGILNLELVEFLRKVISDGYEVIVWSSRGTEYAQKAAEKAGIHKIITAAISKPSFLVDDDGWNWIKYSKIINSFPYEGLINVR